MRLAGTLVGEGIGSFIAGDAHVGRDPLDMYVSVLLCMMVEFADGVHKRAVCFGCVVFGDGDGGVCAVCENVYCVVWL